MARERKLTREERILWLKVARAARPLPERLDSMDEDVDQGNGPEPATGGGRPAIQPQPQARRSRALAPIGQPPPLNPIERPVRRKIARGRLALEARIDLHGMMQAEAHDLLHAFLLSAHERGLRHVLVITGKGSSFGSEGILKRAVPQWLAHRDFRGLVSGYETAARGHGGEGALYVRLKRRQKDGA